MKILVAAYACDPSRGSEPGVGWHLARELARTHDVWVLTRRNNREPIERELAERPQPRMRFLYVDLPRWLSVWKRGQRGVRLYSYLWEFAARRAARSHHRHVSFDLVQHATFANAFLPALTWLPGVPFVLGPVGGGVRVPWRLVAGPSAAMYEALRTVRRLVGRYLDPFVHRTWRRADLILAQNDDTASWLPEECRGKVRVFPNAGFDPERVRRTSNRSSGLIAITPGRMQSLKGTSLAIRAVASADISDLRLLVVGGGPQRQDLETLSRSLGVQDQVIFVPWVPQSDLFRLYAHADVLLFPSLHDESPAVVAEALGHGVVPIALDHGGPPEVAGGVGWFVPVEDRTQDEVVAAMADSLRTAHEPGTLARLRREALRRADTLSWDSKGVELRRMLETVAPAVASRSADDLDVARTIRRITARKVAWYAPPMLLAFSIFRWGFGGRTLALTGLLLAISIVWLPGWAWALFAAGWALVIRFFTGNGLLPSILDLADVPLVYFGLGVVVLRTGGAREVWPRVARQIAIALLALFIATMLSWALSRSELLRPLVTFLLWAEPFALVLAFVLEPPDARGRRVVLWVGAVLVAIQLPIAIVQSRLYGPGDPVQGTLVGAGAGAHLLAAITVIAGVALVAFGYARGVLVGIASTIVALPLLVGVPLMTDAKQVIFALPLAALVLLLVTPGFRARLGLMVPIAMVLPILLLSVPAGATAVRFLTEASEGRSGKLVASQMVTDEMGADLARWAFGLGPAEGVSRAAFLTSWVSFEPSPLGLLGLQPAPLPSKIIRQAEQVATGSSFNNPLSSAIGVFGDIGLVGTAAYLSLLGVLVAALLRRRHHWAAQAALAGWVMSLPLAFTFDWWEQPPFMLALAVLSSLALTSSSEPGPVVAR